MEYIKIKAVFSEFFPYLKSNMEPMERHKLCIMHQDTEEEQDIYIATEEEKFKKIISERYQIQLTDKPQETFNENPQPNKVLSRKTYASAALDGSSAGGKFSVFPWAHESSSNTRTVRIIGFTYFCLWICCFSIYLLYSDFLSALRCSLYPQAKRSSPQKTAGFRI